MSNLTVVISAVVGNGAKYVATELAKKVCDKGRKTLLIDFNFEHPYLVAGLVEEERQGLDLLLPLMPNGNVDEETFKKCINSTSFGPDILLGIGASEHFSRFSGEQIDGILGVAKALYEEVIVVISPKFNNAATPHALASCDNLILVLRENLVNIKEINKIIRLFEQFYVSERPVYVVYNYETDQMTGEINDILGQSFVSFRVVETLKFDTKSVDHASIHKKNGIFSKQINDQAFEEICKKIMKGGSR